MDQRLKERLIGAVVLVALAVWVIPWILDGPERAASTETAALELPAAEESTPARTVTIDLDDRERPDVPAPEPAEAEQRAETSARAAASADEPAATERRAAAPADDPAAAERRAAARPEPASGEAAGSPPAAEGAGPGGSQTADASTPAAADGAPAGGADGDWLVQLGAFGEAGNAARLARRVASFGYSPEVSTYTAGGRDMHRVRVGPQPSRARAEAVASALSAHGFVAQVVTAE